MEGLKEIQRSLAVSLVFLLLCCSVANLAYSQCLSCFPGGSIHFGSNTIISSSACYTAASMDNHTLVTVQSGVTLTVCGDWTGQNGDGITVNNGGTLIITGKLDLANTFQLISNGSVSIGSIELDNGSTMQVQGSGTLAVTGNVATGNQSSISVADGGNLDVGGNFTLGTGATIDVTGTFVVDGSLSAGSGTTVTVSGILDVGGTITGIQPSGASVQYRSVATGNWATNSTWEYSTNGTNWYAASGTPTSANGTITIRNGHNVSIAASVIADELTVDIGGTLTINSGQTLTIANGVAATDCQVNGSLSNIGVVTTTGTLTVGATGMYKHAQNGGAIPTATWSTGSTCNVTGITSTAPTGHTQNFYNLIWNCPNQTITCEFNSTVTIGNNLTVTNTNTGILTLGEGTGSINYTLTVNNKFQLDAGKFYINLSSSTGSNNMIVSDSTVLNGGTFAIHGSSLSTSTASFTTGDIQIANGASFDCGLSSNTSTINLKGSITNSGTGVFKSTSSQVTINFNGNGSTQVYNNSSSGYLNTNLNTWTIASGAVVRLASNLIVPSATGVQSFTCHGTLVFGTGSSSGVNDFYVQVAATSSDGASTDYFSVTSTGKLKLTSAYGIYKNTNGNNTLGNIRQWYASRYSSTYLSEDAVYEFIGDVAQVTGAGFPTTIKDSLIINNTQAINSSNTGVSLSQAITISGTLKLAAGVLTTTTNLLSITNTSSAAISGGSATAFVNGPLKWTVANSGGGNYKFQIGKSGTYLPLNVSNPVGTSPAITVQAFVTSSGGSASTGLTSISTSEYWSIINTGTLTSSTISLAKSNIGSNDAISSSTTLAAAYTNNLATCTTTSMLIPSNTITAGATSGSFLSATYFVMATTLKSTITLASNTINAASICTASVKVPIQSFSLNVTGGSGNLTNIGFTTTGSYAQTDITKYQLWYGATNSIGSASQLGTDLLSSGIAGLRTFAAFTSPTLNSGSTYYFWITVDVASSVTNNNTIAVNAITTSDLTSISTKAGTTSAGGTLTFNIASVGGTIAGSATVCTGTNSTGLTLSGHTGSITRWESSLDNFATAGTTIANTNTTQTSTNLSATTYYRAVITNGVCASTNSGIATVTVDAASVGGTIAGSATVCTGTNSTGLTLSGHTGSVTRWESSLDNFATAGTTIANTNTTQTATNLSATTYYRAVITNGVCASTNSGIATVTINPLPTLTSSGIISAVNSHASSQTSSLTYTASTNSPTIYSIDWDATANAANLTDQVTTNHTFISGGSTISHISIPANVTNGSYNGILTFTNTSGCSGSLAVSIVINPRITTFYFKGSGNMNDKSSWTEHVNGGNGTEPISMSEDGYTFNIFHLGSNSNPSLNGDWILGAGSKIVVGNGNNHVNLTLPYNITGGQIEVANNATLTITNTISPTFGNINAGSVIVYAGTSPQTLPNAANIPNLTINNVNGVTISGNTTISGTLTLNNGKLIVPSNTTLTLGTSTTDLSLSGGSNLSYISTANETALIKRYINSNTIYNFPMGEGNNYSPMNLNFTAGATLGAFITTYVKNTVAPGFVAANFANYINRYWSVSPSGLSGTPNYIITYTYVDGDIYGDETRLVPVKVSGGTWYKPVSYVNTGLVPNITNGLAEGIGGVDVATNTLTWSGLSTFSFDMAAGDEAEALPIHLLYFKVKPESGKVRFDWSTASETNNDFFTIERSKTGYDFSPILNLPGVGTSTTTLYYFGYDKAPLEGVSYYRLKQTDFDGKFEYSAIESVNFKTVFDKDLFVVYPNPSSDNKVHIDVSSESDKTIYFTLYDAVGIVIYSSIYDLYKGKNTTTLNYDNVAHGLYILEVRNDIGEVLEQVNILIR